MQPFVKETGILAALDRANVDTDQIVPAQFLKRIEKTGFGQFLFHSWRFLKDGIPNPEFEINKPAYQGATILVTGRNFGCGSSREHAVWALQDYGFRAIIAPSFAEIFHRNCFENGVLPVHLSEALVRQIMDKAKASTGYRLTVDLERCELYDDKGFRTSFKLHNDPETHRHWQYRLLNGLDEISLTLQHEDKIAEYERRTQARGY